MAEIRQSNQFDGELTDDWNCPKTAKRFSPFHNDSFPGVDGRGRIPTGARADEQEAKRLFKAMSVFATEKTMSFSYDSNLEIVTKDKQKIALASSGTVTLERPDKARITRRGGFADIESVFDGKTLTLLGKNANLYAQVNVPGTIDQLVDELRDKYHRPVPGADLLLSNIYEKLMPDVTDVKDLGSGVIGGVEWITLPFAPRKSTGRYGSRKEHTRILVDM